MHPSNIFSLLAAATMATAMPGKPYKGGDGSPPATNNVCGQDQKLSCCNSAGLSVLGIECSLSSDCKFYYFTHCFVDPQLMSTIVGGNCNGNVQCCDVSQNVGLPNMKEQSPFEANKTQGQINLVNLCVPIAL